MSSVETQNFASLHREEIVAFPADGNVLHLYTVDVPFRFSMDGNVCISISFKKNH